MDGCKQVTYNISNKKKQKPINKNISLIVESFKIIIIFLCYVTCYCVCKRRKLFFLLILNSSSKKRSSLQSNIFS